MILLAKPHKLLAFEFGVTRRFHYTFKSLAHFEREMGIIKYELMYKSLKSNKPSNMNIMIKDWDGYDIAFNLIINAETLKWDVKRL